MTRIHKFIPLIFSSLLAACSTTTTSVSSTPVTTTAPTSGAAADNGAHTEHAEHSEHSEHAAHHRDMPPAVSAFHEVLRPLWHSAPGADRDSQTCAQAGTLLARSNEIMSAGSPANTPADRAAQFSSAATQLNTSVRSLQSQCASTPRGNVAAELETVHTAFHHLVETR